MKYIIILSLFALLSCEAMDNYTEPLPAITADPHPYTRVPEVEEPTTDTPKTLLDSIRLQMPLTQIQLASRLQIDTAWEKNGIGISANPLGDSLSIIVMTSTNGTCGYAYVCVMNRYTLHLINKMRVRADCEMDTIESDEVNFSFTDHQEFIITTDVYANGDAGNGPAVSKREYWTITYDGQFKKSRPDDEEVYGG